MQSKKNKYFKGHTLWNCCSVFAVPEVVFS